MWVSGEGRGGAGESVGEEEVEGGEGRGQVKVWVSRDGEGGER